MSWLPLSLAVWRRIAVSYLAEVRREKSRAAIDQD
jgi:hypothetical protein